MKFSDIIDICEKDNKNRLISIIDKKIYYGNFDIDGAYVIKHDKTSVHIDEFIGDIQLSKDDIIQTIKSMLIGRFMTSGYTLYSETGFKENEVRLDDSVSKEFDLLHCAVGMMSEAGEILDLIKKRIFHSKPVNKEDIISEIGDMEWYKYNMMRLLDIKPEMPVYSNRIKLDIRYPNGRKDKNITKNTEHENVEIKNRLL